MCAVIVVMLFGGYYAAQRVLHVNQKARDYLMTRISTELGASLTVSSISVVPWIVSFNGLKINLKDTRFTIEIERLRIGFNILELIRNNFRPIYGTEQIYLERPRFVWTLGVSDTLSSTKLPNISMKNLPKILMNIRNGSFIVRRDGEIMTLAERVDGWLDGRSGSKAEFKIESRVLSSKTNTSCSGFLDRDTDSARMNLSAQACDFSRPEITVLTGRMVPQAGRMNLFLNFGYKDGKITCRGDFQVDDASVSLRDTRVNISDMRIHGRVTEEQIFFDSATGLIWGVKPDLKGSIRFLPEPSLDMDFSARGADLSRIYREIFPEMKESPRGRADVRARMKGSTEQYTCDAAISSRSIVFRNRSAEDILVTMKLEPGKVHFNSIGGVFSGCKITGKGLLGGEKRTGLQDFAAEFKVKNLQNDGHVYVLRFKGAAGGKNRPWTASYDARDEGSADTILRHVNGDLILTGNTLDFTCGNTVFFLNGKATDVFSAPKVESNVTMNRFPVLNFVGIKNSGLILDGSGELAGTPGAFSINGNFDLEYGERIHAKIDGVALFESVFRKNRKISADTRIYDLRVRYSEAMELAVSLNSDSMATTAIIDDVQGQAHLFARVIHETGNLSGQLNLADFPMEKIIDIFESRQLSHKGKLTGIAQIGGTVRKPGFYTPRPIHVSDLNVSVIDRLSADGNVSGKIGELSFSDVEVRRDGKPIVYADGVWTTGTPFVLTAGGEGVDFNAIGDVISKDRKIDGSIDYGVTMRFTRKSGTIDGSFSVLNGHFLDIPFDSASGELGGGSDGFRATSFRIIKEGVFSGTGSAKSGFIWKDATPNPGLNMNLDLKGKLTRALPYLTTAIRNADGESRLILTLGGTWQDPSIVSGRLSVTDGMVSPSFLIDKVSDIHATLVVDQETQTPSGMKAVRIVSASGTVKNKKLVAENVFDGDEKWSTVQNPELLHVVNGVIGLDFGVFTGRIERGKNRDRSLELHVPGFMKQGEFGRFELPEEKGGMFIVGASAHEGRLTPYIAGTIRVLAGDITFPLLQYEDSSSGENTYLEKIFWNMEIYAGSSVYYFNEISKTIDETRHMMPHFKFKIPLAGATISKTMAKLDEKSTFSVTGRIEDASFRVTGDARSTSGTVSYVGVEFDIEIIEFNLDTARVMKPAFLSARAKTTVYDDSTGVETEIYLKVNAVDKTSGWRKKASGRADAPEDNYAELGSELSMVVDAGSLGLLEIEFSSTNPTDNTREKVLARLGLSAEHFGTAATRALAQGMDDYYIDLIRPVEDAMRKYTGLDVVRFTPSVIGNLVRSKLVLSDRFGPDSDYMLFDGSRIMLGEYFVDSFFLSYKGQYGLGRDFLRRKERGFYHEMSLQYILQRNTRFQLNYNYDGVIRQNDKRFEIRHDFEF